MAVLVQNENMKNQSLNFKGETYPCDAEGVIRCSTMMAKFLMKTPGWHEFERDRVKDASLLENDILQAEANLQAAERKLKEAKEKLVEFNKLVKGEEKLDAADIPDPVEPEVAAAPLTEEIAEEDYPTMQWTKARMITFAEKHEIDVDSSDSKADLLAAIEAAFE
jgi:hypothetical protein